MTNRSFFLAAASVAALMLGAGSASAQDSRFYGAVSVGSTQVETDMSSLSPEGVTIEFTGGDALLVHNKWTIAAEASGSYSQAEASMRTQVCDVANCGYDEWETETAGITWSAKFGFRVSHPVGPVTLSLGAGIVATEYNRGYGYDSAGAFPNYRWNEDGYGVGSYYDVSVAYPVNENWSLVGTYGRSDLTVREWSSTYGSNAEGFETETWSFGVRRDF